MGAFIWIIKYNLLQEVLIKIQYNHMQKTILYYILVAIIGIFIGWLLFGKPMRSLPAGTHRMPDGRIMSDNGPGMASMMHDMNANLTGKTGDEFDKAFLDDMIIHHQGAVDMAQAVLKNSKRPELIKLANDIITAQTVEIDMMKKWQKEWFAQQ